MCGELASIATPIESKPDDNKDCLGES